MVMPIYVGFDSREVLQYRVCVESLRDQASIPLTIIPLKVEGLKRGGLYYRDYHHDGARLVDQWDGEISTEFTYTRYLVPLLCSYASPALFCDSDMLWRGDVADLFDLYDPCYAVQCVHHAHRPLEALKMRGSRQTVYPRKNWSSMVLWNCAHPAHADLTTYCVNHATRRWLHGFSWLSSEQIGPIPHGWNWLEGFSPRTIEPKVVHFTRGTPDMLGHERGDYACEWAKVADGIRRRDNGDGARARCRESGADLGQASAPASKCNVGAQSANLEARGHT